MIIFSISYQAVTRSVYSKEAPSTKWSLLLHLQPQVVWPVCHLWFCVQWYSWVYWWPWNGRYHYLRRHPCDLSEKTKKATKYLSICQANPFSWPSYAKMQLWGKLGRNSLPPVFQKCHDRWRVIKNHEDFEHGLIYLQKNNAIQKRPLRIIN